MSFRFLDLFAGIGGMRLAFSRAGGQCVFTSEWDRAAQITYEANFGEKPEGDITAIGAEDIPDADILVGGFPCQPFSIAGVSKKNALGRKHGFGDETQGTLFFDILRILSVKRPSAILLENVKNLRSHDGGKTFQVIVENLERLGYHLKIEIVNAASVLPQNRARIFIAGFLDPAAAERFSFPESENFPLPDYLKLRPTRWEEATTDRSAYRPRLGDILEKSVDAKYTLSDHLWNYLQAYRDKHRKAGHGFGFGLCGPADIARTLSARYYKDGSEILIKQRPSKRNPGANPRRLTPNECRRLMGFPEDFQIVVSDTQAYKQFGNSVAVPVVSAIAEEMARSLAAASRSRRKWQTAGKLASAS
ncbi:MAG: DNA (cytosine-5-)-methyltransferase [Leptospiraceae bacterium]|nr:DNA (cytosine-5-)-methyltransferase [Leptospiraceae bacterium]